MVLRASHMDRLKRVEVESILNGGSAALGGIIMRVV